MTWDDRPPEDQWFSVDPKGHREDDSPVRARRGPSFLSVLLGLVVVAIAVVAWVNHSDADRTTVQPTPTRTTSRPTPSTPSDPSSTSTSPTPSPTVSTTAGRRPPLGSTRPWDLVVLSTDGLTRIEMATGRTVHTVLPVGPERPQMVIVDLGGRLLLQPTYEGTALLVGDDGAVTEAPGRFPGPGLVVRALGTESFWLVSSGPAQNRLELVGRDGKVVPGASVELSQDLYGWSARSDGGRALLVEGLDGVYRLDAGRVRRVTTGTVLGRREDGWLVQECDEEHRCQLALVDRDTGRRQEVGGPIPSPAGGSVSPDGRRAFVFTYQQDAIKGVVVDLGSGNQRTVSDVSGNTSTGPSAAAIWSPDSRWLVTTTDSGRVVAVDVATGATTELWTSGPSELLAIGARYR